MSGKIKIIKVQNIDISVVTSNGNDYICITDIAKSKVGESRAADIIKNWVRSRTTLEFLGTWEQMYNLHFKVVEFDHFKMQAGLPSFVLSPGQWVEKTNAIGIYVKLGKYGGTYAHKDIAFEFCSAISPVFKLFLIKEFQRLKDDENDRLRDHATIEQLVVLSNMESINAVLIQQQLIQSERISQLNKIAITQMKSLINNQDLRKLK